MAELIIVASPAITHFIAVCDKLNMDRRDIGLSLSILMQDEVEVCFHDKLGHTATTHRIIQILRRDMYRYCNLISDLWYQLVSNFRYYIPIINVIEIKGRGDAAIVLHVNSTVSLL